MSKATTVRHQFISLLTLIAFVLLAQATIIWYLSAGVLINGDRYQRIVASKDLIADALPPPANLLETHLIVQQLISNINTRLLESNVTQLNIRSPDAEKMK